MDDGLSFAWLPKAAVYGLGQLAIGIGIVRRLDTHARSGSGTSAAGLEGSLTRFARAVALLLLLALALRLWVQTVSAFGQSDAWAIDNLRVIAFESRWGRGWRLQVTAATVLLAAVLVVPGRQSRWILFEIGAVGLALALPLLGHAAGSAWRYGMHAAHNLAAAAWLGTVGVITITAWQSGARSSLERLVRCFSPIALTSAGVVFASGVVAAWVYVGSWSSLWATSYGRVLIAKLLGVAVVMACGGMNWRETRGGRVPRRALLTIEWLAALLVVGFTSVLTETEHP